MSELEVRSDYIFVIAEIGINHNGSLELAKRLIDVASECGCDAVKFQKRSVETVYSSEVLAAPRDSPWGTTTRDQKYGLEFGLDEYVEIDRYCSEKQMSWSASAWDVESQTFLEQFRRPFNKVASAMITHLEFLEAVAREGKITLLSTGMSSREEIESALAVFVRHECPVVLLHSTSVYPSPESILNLRAIETMAQHFGLHVGYSGHEATLYPSIVAASLGARVIERHITVDRSMYGSDQAASLSPRGLAELVQVLRRLPAMLGDGEKRWMPGEDEVARKLRYWE